MLVRNTGLCVDAPQMSMNLTSVSDDGRRFCS